MSERRQPRPEETEPAHEQAKAVNEFVVEQEEISEKSGADARRFVSELSAEQVDDLAPPDTASRASVDVREPSEKGPAGETVEERLHGLLTRPILELRAADLPEIETHEQDLIKAMHAIGLSGKTFAQIAEGFRAPVKKRLQDRALFHDGIVSHIVDLRRLCHEYFRKIQLEFEAAEKLRLERVAARERHQLIEAQQLREKQEAEDTLKKSEQQGENLFRDWNRQRQPLDNRGQPRDYFPDDRALVDLIESRARQQSEAGRDFHETTARLERVFADLIDDQDIFGAETVVSAKPASKFDDIVRHVDIGLRHRIPGVERILGIDFSVTGDEVEMARKLNHGFDKPIGQLKYKTAHFESGQEFIPFVLTLDAERAKRLMRWSNFKKVNDPENKVHRQMAEQFEHTIESYHDREILKYTIVEEALEQAKFQLEVMEQRQIEPEYLSDHRALVDYLDKLLIERKDLRDVAEAEVNKTSVSRVYRTRDPEFIRSVAVAA